MISETQLYKVGGSLMVLIPDTYVKYLKIDKNGKLGTCKIEDINENEVKIVF